MEDLLQKAVQSFEKQGFSTRIFHDDSPMLHVIIQVGWMEIKHSPVKSFFILILETVNKKPYWLVSINTFEGVGISNSIDDLVQRAESYQNLENATDTIGFSRAFQLIQQQTGAETLLQPGNTIHIYPGEHVEIRDDDYKLRVDVLAHLLELEATPPPITLVYDETWTITIYSAEEVSEYFTVNTLEEAVNKIIELLSSSKD